MDQTKASAILGFFLTATVLLFPGCAKLQEDGQDAAKAFSISITQCTICHGSANNPAPPKDTQGNTATSFMTVGAHQSHLSPVLGKAVACTECHVVPDNILSPGHILHQPARLVFGALASQDTTAVWDRSTGTCTTYCHLSARPVWNAVDGSQKKCTSCHGFPPVLPHPQLATCSSCHGDVVAADNTIINAEKHINGTKDIATMNCSSCHGGPNNPAPPTDTAGRAATTLLSVGAHQAHLNPVLAPAVPCSECHVVPSSIDDPGHIQGQRARVVLGTLSKRGGVQASYDPATGTCITYCHGQSIPPAYGGTAKTPVWNVVDGSQKQCGSCHGFPPADGNTMGHNDINSGCSTCHSGYGTANVDVSHHINGIIENQTNCLDCHGARELCYLGIKSYCNR